MQRCSGNSCGRRPSEDPRTELATVAFAVQPGHTYLIEVEERGNDALVEVLDSKREVIARADHPERRTGTRRAVAVAPGPSLIIRVTGKEHSNVVGTATVRAVDVAVLQTRPDCTAIMKMLAAADASYAAGEEIARGRSTFSTSSARYAFKSAAEGYRASASVVSSPADRALRGQTALALASLEYLDLQDWDKTAEWAKEAAALLGSDDPYRRARAEALVAAAWLEIGSAAPAGRPVSGYGMPSAELLARARWRLQSLSHFHLQRGERYDAGLQLTNIGLTYLYEGRYPECVAAFATSSRLFATIHETQRRRRPGEPRLVPLGHGAFADALRWLQTHADIGPEPYPSSFLP